MFQSDELNIMHNNYFIIIKKKVNYVTLQSKDTWHCWHILHQDYATFKSCIIYHNHSTDVNNHIYSNVSPLNDTLSLITAHNTFQIKWEKET